MAPKDVMAVGRALRIAAAALCALLLPFARAEGEPPVRTARLRITGDVMVTADQLTSSRGFGGTYDFTDEFRFVRECLSDADMTIANLETTVGRYKDRPYSGYPQFNSPPEILYALRWAGVDMLTLANNHMLDRWFDGLKNTVDWVEDYGFRHVGAYPTREARSAPVICEVNGIRIGFLAYTESANTMENYSSPDVREYAVPFLHSADIAGDVKRLRDAGAEFVICFPHWGIEYAALPGANQKAWANALCGAGVDVIIGSHPHVLQPWETRRVTGDDGAERDVLLFWSMGNFVSSIQKTGADAGLVLEITLTADGDGGRSAQVTGLFPTYCWTFGPEGERECRVVLCAEALEDPPEGMNEVSYARMRAAYKTSRRQLGMED